MRNDSTAAFESFERMRLLCYECSKAMVVGTKSSYSSTCLGEGEESVVFSYINTADPLIRYVIKFDKDPAWSDSFKRLKSVRRIEVDATCLVWQLITAPGLSPHTVRPYGLLPFKFDATAAPYHNEGVCISGIVMEYLEGLDVHGLIKAGCAGKFGPVTAGGFDPFDDLLRVVVFQVFYTVAMWNLASNTGFRHNDLHSGNVCLTYWNEEHTAMEMEYHIPDPVTGLDRVFVLHTPYCVTIIDYGNAALLPCAGGPAYDGRFYSLGSREPTTRDPKAPHGLKEMKHATWGMSHCKPSAHYDSTFFAFAVLQLFGRQAVPAGKEYRQFYARCFGSVHSSTKFMFQKELAGRLTPEGQRLLMAGKQVRVRNKTFSVMDASQALSDVYFARFRGLPAADRKYVYGLRASVGARPPLLRPDITPTNTRMAAHVEEASWRPVLNAASSVVNTPKPGSWAALMTNLQRILAGVKLPVRPTHKQLRCWVDGGDADDADNAEKDSAPTWDEPGFDYEAARPRQNL